MMDSIRTVAQSICVTLIVTGIFSMLVPSQSMEKVMRFAISLFFLSGIIMPFVCGDFHFSFNVSEPIDKIYKTELENESQKYFLNIAQKNINEQTQMLLEKNKIYPEKIESTIHIEADESIIINELKIYLPACEKADSVIISERVKAIVESELDLKAEVVFGSG